MSKKNLSYILKRIILAILTVWVVITLTFFVMRAVPGGPFMSEKAITPAAQAALEAKYGLDKPLFEQYTTYLKDIAFHMDFGPSLKQRGRMVIDVISDGLKTSAKLGVIAAVFAAMFVHYRIADADIVLGQTGMASGKRRDCQGPDPSHNQFGSLSYELHHQAYQIVHAGRTGAGLHQDCQGQGCKPCHDHLRTRFKEQPYPCHHLLRTHARIYRNGFPCS